MSSNVTDIIYATCKYCFDQLTAREAVPYKTKRQKRTATLFVFAFFDSCCGIDSEKVSNAIVSYVENQLRLTEKIPCLFA